MNGLSMTIQETSPFYLGKELDMSKPYYEDTQKKRDPDTANAEVALRRAAKQARERAKKAGLKIPVYRNGQLVEEQPE